MGISKGELGRDEQVIDSMRTHGKALITPAAALIVFSAGLGLGLAALPMLVSGLYGLLTGAAYGAEHVGFKLWAKPPLAYLVVGLVLAVGAALAIDDAWVVRAVE